MTDVIESGKQEIDVDEVMVLREMLETLKRSGISVKKAGSMILGIKEGKLDSYNLMITVDSVYEEDGELMPISAQIREWVDEEVSTGVLFLSRDCPNVSMLSTRRDKKTASQVFSRLVDEGTLVRGNRLGQFKKINKDLIKMEKGTPKSEGEDIKLPLGLNDLVKLYPGNIVIVAGQPNAGKSALLYNIAADNMGKWKIHFFNSESGPDELTDRLSQFDDVPLDDFFKDVNFFERSEDFASAIVPGRGNLNIIDFMEIHENHYLIGKWLKEIHDKLDGALCVIALQKKAGRDEGVGGMATLEKPRLYLSMSPGVIKITKAKAWRNPRQNPNGKEITFKLVAGCNFITQDAWSAPEEIENTKVGDDLPW